MCLLALYPLGFFAKVDATINFDAPRGPMKLPLVFEQIGVLATIASCHGMVQAGEVCACYVCIRNWSDCVGDRFQCAMAGPAVCFNIRAVGAAERSGVQQQKHTNEHHEQDIASTYGALLADEGHHADDSYVNGIPQVKADGGEDGMGHLGDVNGDEGGLFEVLSQFIKVLKK